MALTLRSDPIRFLHVVMIALQVFAVVQVVWWLVRDHRLRSWRIR